MISLGVSKEDAKKHTPQSNKKIKVKCPNCGKEKEIAPATIFNSNSIFCNCGDGVSYPEKFIISLLNQLDIKYIKEYSPEWIKPKRYDFYFELNNKKIIVEVNGGQHYNDKTFSYCRGKTLQEEQENDKYKKELALNNGIDCYIELNCKKSNLEWIKNSILYSKLNKIFDLSQIDWLKCEEFALSNRVKEICDYWKLHNEINKENLTTKDLEIIFNLCYDTIRSYLKKGSKLGWCNYNSEEEIKKGRSKSGKNGKQVEIFKNGKSLGVFSSCSELERQSEELFGVKFHHSGVSQVARCNTNLYKGFTFKYL